VPASSAGTPKLSSRREIKAWSRPGSTFIA
jgi:hypothetical protein